MPRVKRGPSHVKKRRKILKAAKGYRHGRKKLIKLAKVAILKAGAYAYRDRKVKKRSMRRLWQIKLNAAVRVFDISYSKFIALLKKNNVELDRKVLADMAENNTELFAKIVEKLAPEAVKVAEEKAEAPDATKVKEGKEDKKVVEKKEAK